MQHTQNHSLITTTCNTPEVRDAIINALLEAHLAACVQVSQVQSHYRWGGKITQAEEFALTIKTQTLHTHSVVETIRNHHPYQVPEILEIAIDAGSKTYLSWIDEVTTPQLNNNSKTA